MAALSLTDFHQRIGQVRDLPSMPAILVPVLNQLNGQSDHIDLDRTIKLVAHDKALTAQVLHMANSPLFGLSNRALSLRSAALVLGVARLRNIVTACALLQLSPKNCSVDIAAFWEHSLSCALVSRDIARKVRCVDPERAYLAGLVHDIGFLINMILIPSEFAECWRGAARSARPLHVAENETFGFTHAITGDMLSTRWRLFDYLTEVIRRHHDPASATLDPPLTAVVHIADLLCRVSSLGYGYTEDIELSLRDSDAWRILAQRSPLLASWDVARFTLEIEDYMREVRTVVSVLFRM